MILIKFHCMFALAISDHLNHQEHVIETQIRDLKRIIVAASQNSAKSDAQLAKALSEVHHELEEADNDREKILEIKPSNQGLDANQILTGLGIIMCAAVIFGNVFGRIS